MDDEHTGKGEHPAPDFAGRDDLDDLRSGSATDCTGAMPRPPQDSAELDAFLDVYDFLPQPFYANPSKPESDVFRESRDWKSNTPQ